MQCGGGVGLKLIGHVCLARCFFFFLYNLADAIATEFSKNHFHVESINSINSGFTFIGASTG